MLRIGAGGDGVIAASDGRSNDAVVVRGSRGGVVRASDGAVEADAATIAVVVCTYDEARWSQLWAAFDSLFAQHRTPDEIVIVVDHNERLLDRVLAELARRDSEGRLRRGPRIVVSPNRQPPGLSGGRNTALAQTGCDLVAFLDDDATAEPEWLALLAATFARPSVVVAGSSVTPCWESGARPAWLPGELDWTVGCTHAGTPQHTSEVRNPFGGAMMLRRDAVVTAGGYRHDLGRVGNDLAGCEETELCIRLRRRLRGAVVIYEPSATILHRVPRARARWSYVVSRCLAEGRSKALVASLAGRQRGLQNERRYIAATVPRGVARGLRDAVHGDAWGVTRATTLAVGVAVAAVGFLDGRVRTLRRSDTRGHLRPGEAPAIPPPPRTRATERAERATC